LENYIKSLEEKFQKENQRKENVITRLHKEKNELKQVLYGFEEAKEDMDILMSDMKEKNLKLEKLNEEVIKENDGFLKENERMHLIIENLKSENKKFRKENGTVLSENDSFLKENERLYVQNQNLAYENKYISRENNKFKKLNEKMRLKSACLTNENAKLKKKIWCMVKDKEECIALKSSSMQENESLMLKNEKLNELYKDTKIKLVEFENQHDEVTKKFNSLNQSYKSLAIENQNFLKKVIKVEGEKNSLRSEIEGEKVKVSSLEKEILVKSKNLDKSLNEKEVLENQLVKVISRAKENETTVETIKDNYVELQLLAASIMKKTEKKKFRLFCF